MIKTTREIRTEEDRFGGYIPRTESARRRVEVDLNVDPETDLHFSRRTFAEPDLADKPVAAPKKEESIYSTLDKPRRTVTAPARKPAAVRRAAEDVMPSIRTEKTEKPARETAPVHSAGLLSSKTKVMLALYVTVAVILAAIVIATGIVLSSSTAAVSSLENSIAMRNETLAAQTAEILNLENDTMLAGLATEQGMTKPGSVSSIDLLPVVEPGEIAARSNWFDKLCDFFNKIF